MSRKKHNEASMSLWKTKCQILQETPMGQQEWIAREERFDFSPIFVS